MDPLGSKKAHMGNIVVLLVVAVIVVFAIRGTVRKVKYGGGCCGTKEPVTKVRVADKDPSHYPYHYALHVDGMTCQNCQRRVENALDKMDGVWAKVDLQKATADVLAKKPYTEDQFRDTVKDAGYILLSSKTV